MREILFRGKGKYNGEWVYGVPVQYSDGDWQIQVGHSNARCCVTVVPETIGQYTGLLDKNGTKIFEGDIIKDTTDNELLVVEGSTAFGFDFKYATEPDAYVTAFDLGISEDDTYLTSCIVVGNIHSNPKLLEVE